MNAGPGREDAVSGYGRKERVGAEQPIGGDGWGQFAGNLLLSVFLAVL